MIDLQKGYRMVDLSEEVIPDLLELNGDYTWGTHVRRFILREFIAKIDNLPMHFVEAETHIGTHVELPSHLKKDGKSSSEMPFDIFLGEAIVLNFDFLTPKDGQGQAITPSHLSKVKKGDIVLMWSSYEGKEHPYISAEAIKWLAQLPIKMIGTEPSVEGEDPRSEEPGFSEAWATHRYALGNDIPIIDNLCNLKEIKKERVFFIGLPLKIAHLEASWIRAIALEPLS
jgi:arylformamidase